MENLNPLCSSRTLINFPAKIRAHENNDATSTSPDTPDSRKNGNEKGNVKRSRTRVSRYGFVGFVLFCVKFDDVSRTYDLISPSLSPPLDAT